MASAQLPLKLPACPFVHPHAVVWKRLLMRGDRGFGGDPSLFTLLMLCEAIDCVFCPPLQSTEQDCSVCAGIVSCIAFNPDRSGLIAAGSYSGQAGLYDASTHELLFLLQGQKGGLTQVTFFPTDIMSAKSRAQK